MAIYTSYGRYIKAKLFKDELENKNDSYLVLGLGNPKWDEATSGQNIPVAPYNTAIISDGDINTNQFYDNNINQYYLQSDASVIQTLNDGQAIGSYIQNCATLNPPCPCIWQHYTENEDLLPTSGTTITQNNYQLCYLDLNQTNIVVIGDGNTPSTYAQYSIDPTTFNQEQMQYYAELYLRGKAKLLANTLGAEFKHPVGLLGAVKCSVTLVRDLQEAGKEYTADANQFWYGDRYWETVNPNDADIDFDAEISTNPKKYLYPHHVLISAIINPRQLCTNLTVDRNLAPRQISLYTKAKSNDPLNPNPNEYRVEEFIFNFGQYTTEDLQYVTSTKVLNFTLPYEQDNSHHYSNGDFKFVMNDYIKGAIRDVHSAERIGYIVGF